MTTHRHDPNAYSIAIAGERRRVYAEEILVELDRIPSPEAAKAAGAIRHLQVWGIRYSYEDFHLLRRGLDIIDASKGEHPSTRN